MAISNRPQADAESRGEAPRESGTAPGDAALPDGTSRSSRPPVPGTRRLARRLVIAATAIRKLTIADAVAAARRLWKLFLGPLLATVLALGLLLAVDLLLFRDAILGSMVYSRSDTATYYFPIANRLAEVLRQGRLMLWTPYLFGGFPLFADGEGGMLYPPNLLAYLLLPENEAFIWLRVVRYFMGSLFTYLYLRSMRLNRFAAVLGALSFAYGSFLVMQMHHTNVGNTAIWLPLTLYFVEMSVRRVGRWRWLYATGAGASVGIQALGVHIQPLLMSGLLLAFYIPFRVLLCPIAWPSRKQSAISNQQSAISNQQSADGDQPLAVNNQSLAVGDRSPADGGRQLAAGARSRLLITHHSSLITRLPSLITHHSSLIARRLLLIASRWPRAIWRFLVGSTHRVIITGLLLGLIPAIAFGIAAVQMIPEVELGGFSFRGHGVNYVYATSYSMPIQNLVDLVFPYFFRYTNRFYWSLWSEWETSLYVGIAPLVMASVALLFVRSRMVIFYAVMAVLSLLIAFGDYSPVPVFDQLRQLPGFSSLRVPGRFGMLITFSLAVLAAFGFDWLCRTLRPREAAGRLGRWRRFSRAAGVHGFGLYLLGLLSAMAFLVWWLASFRAWIEKEPWAVKQFVESSYLALRSSRAWLTSDMVLNFLNYSLDITNEKTAISLALMLSTFLLLLAWFAFRRLWRAWASLLVLLAAVDLFLFANDFHPEVPISQLTQPNVAIQWLMSQNGDGMLRVYTAPEVRTTEANQLLPFQVADITGYSSLETSRHQDYMANLAEHDKTLLDTYGARFVIVPKRFPALPSYQYTAYNPSRPLANGAAGNRGAHETFYLNPPVPADEVCLISNLRGAADIPQGAEVADIAVVDSSGERYTVKVRAGQETAEWALDRPDVTPNMGHGRPEVADKISVSDENGQEFQANLYYGDLKLDKQRMVERVEFDYTYPRGKMTLYGLMLWENPSTAHQVLWRNKFIPRYEDDEVVILENPSPLPRAFLVSTAQVLPDTSILDTMVNGDFDPAKTVLLETRNRPRFLGLPDPGVADPETVAEWLRGSDGGSPGTAEILDYQPTEVTVRTVSDRNAVLFLSDSHYPGWKALVDGKAQEVLRADYLFRAVLVPAGIHEVRFVFEPETFYLGAETSIFTITCLSILWVGLLVVVPLLSVVWFVVRRRRRKRPAATP